jgi:hypothetical protein
VGWLIVLVTSVIATVAPASGGSTYVLRPDGDITGQWSKIGASTEAAALDDNVTQPTSVGTGDYILAGAPGRVAEVSLSSHTLSGESVNSGTAWFYSAAGVASAGKADVLWGGQVRGSTTWGGVLGASAGWHSISVTPPDQAAVDDLRLRFTSTSGSDVTVRAAYFQLNTLSTSGCSFSNSGSSIGMTVSGCATVAADTASNSDPIPFWGAIECQSSSRFQEVGSGGDTHPTATGMAQGDTAYRRLTAIDGDDFSGERCELGKDDWRDSPVTFYRDGMHLVTYASIRLPSNFPLDTNHWQVVLQMKQAEPSNVGGWYPALALDAYEGQWYFIQAGQGSNDLGLVWQAPAQKNVWTRFAIDVVYSTDPSIGSVRIYADLNNDGDFADGGEQSGLMHMATLAPEMSGDDHHFNVGDPVPSHLRMGLYHDPAIDCPAPSGCSTEIDNVQVMAP